MIFINFQVYHRNEKNFEGSYGLGGRHLNVHLAEHSTRSVVLLNVSLHRADESQVARNSCPRLILG